MERKSGLLLPISALPGPCGIGTLGREAYAFADFLKASGIGCWQILPLGPTAYGDSPYSALSAFAGNPYLIDLELLQEDGLLRREEYADISWSDSARFVDYERLHAFRFSVLKKACERGWERDREALAAFAAENKAWLPDYALFMALKRHFGEKPWTEWGDKAIRCRESEEVIEKYRTRLADDVRLFTYIQFLFDKQWAALKAYVHSLGIKIMGDLPIYVALDSADVWAEPQLFQMDENFVPKAVAGVPPDDFSADGQLWGNPLYDYDRMAKDGFGWWIRRMDGARRLYDMIRIDHFRGFESYWSVPYGAESARSGAWKKGPGMALVGVLRDWFHGTPIIAEDLGILTGEVCELLKDSGFPGMKVLEFAFDPARCSEYLPHKYSHSCVCYVGTHDNETVQQWRHTAKRAELAMAVRYLGLNEEEGYHWGMIRGGMASAADLFIMQMQDCLGLGEEGRMNTPGTVGNNWRWRLLPGEASRELAERLYEYNRMFERL